jgi:ABC-2 type transport system ATP-binding protein
MTAIAVEGLAKRFGAHVAVADATFTVAAGTVCALLGPNGAGKTTTLRCILGLARPTAGTVRVAGRAGAVLDGLGVHPLRTGRDHLRMLAAAGGVPPAHVASVLERVGLAADADRPAGEYSLGMRGRLALGAALLGGPRVLVLDEPANGLDPDGIRWLRGLLREHAEAGGAVLLSSHVLAEVERVADAAVVMAGGRTVGAAPVLDGRSVRARSPDRARLQAALAAAGATVRPVDADGLVVEGRDADFVGALAAREGIALRELVAHRTLEDLYVQATGAAP